MRPYIDTDTYRTIADLMPILCVDCVVVHKGKYLLVKRNNEPLKDEYFVPGGRVNKGETLDDAVRRKMLDEIGIEVKIISQQGYYEDQYDKNELGLDVVHTVGIVFYVSPLTEDVVLDNQSDKYIWSDVLPDRFIKKWNHINN